ncbi:MAG: hypothetical protein FJ387_24630 [Verrucomicrobia bacterium]|nr:hypothetical protein [Verrucomicrobiota bacterium]
MALGTVPEPFILYGGTGLALRLGHRTSVDFDFFCFEFFEVEALRRSARWSVYQRAEAKDYLDVHALLKAGLSLADGLRFAKQVYGPDFTTMLPLQALCYFAEPPLRALSAEVRTALTAAVQSVK